MSYQPVSSAARQAWIDGVPDDECREIDQEQLAELRLVCRHCGARLAHRKGHGGRYRYTDRLDGTDIFGSGCECPDNERGHEPEDVGV